MVPAVSRSRRREAGGMIEGLTACFDGFADPRVTRRCDHRLIDIRRIQAVVATPGRRGCDEHSEAALGSGRATPCCTDRGCRRTEPYPCSGLCDADVLRASQPQHSVQHADSDGYLACLSPVRLEAQPVTDDALPSRDVSLHQSAPVVARGHLVARIGWLASGAGRCSTTAPSLTLT